MKPKSSKMAQDGVTLSTLEMQSEAIRQRQFEDYCVKTIQACIRRYLVQARHKLLYQAAYSIQKYALAINMKKKMDIVRRAAIIIQAWWRGDRVRRIIREEKLNALLLYTQTTAQSRSGSRTLLQMMRDRQ